MSKKSPKPVIASLLDLREGNLIYSKFSGKFELSLMIIDISILNDKFSAPVVIAKGTSNERKMQACDLGKRNKLVRISGLTPRRMKNEGLLIGPFFGERGWDRENRFYVHKYNGCLLMNEGSWQEITIEAELNRGGAERVTFFVDQRLNSE